MKSDDLYIGEYSVKEQCGHICTLGDAIRNNKSTILNNKTTDYLIVAVGINFNEVAIILDEFRKKVEESEEK